MGECLGKRQDLTPLFVVCATLVNDFVKDGILIELTGQKRNRMYIFKEYVMIFNKR